MEELSRAEIDELLHRQLVGRIGCHAEGETYVVPVIYAYDGADFWIVTVEGRKTAMMRTNPDVCFEVDEHDVAGTGGWRSAIARARYEELADDGAARALALLAARFAGRERRRPRGGGRPMVAFRLRVSELTGRAAAG